MLPLELVSIENEVPKTTSLAISDGTGQTHKSVLQLIRTHKSSIEHFGRVAFEMRPFETVGGMQVKRVAILNEGQATLLMTLMKNSKRVVAFKVALVKAFLGARDIILGKSASLIHQYNVVSFAYNDAEKSASSAGRNLAYYGKKAKPELLKRLETLEQQMQLVLNFGQEKADTLHQDEMSAHQLTNTLMERN